MQLEHIAIWTSDLERLRQFYERYFEGKAGANYQNPKRAFPPTSSALKVVRGSN